MVPQEEDWEAVMAVNAKGYWLGARAAATQFLKQEPLHSNGLRGKIINIRRVKLIHFMNSLME